MKYLHVILVIIITVSSISCRKDFTTIDNYGNLEFSKDTVFLDTLFTNIGSATYNLMVYNTGNKAITIPEIKLENTVSSNYRLNIDGIAGQHFENIDILANDSLFVFIETTIDFSTISDPLHTDKILFDNGNNQQDVDLVTLVKDATFIFPEQNAISMEIDHLILNNEITNLQGRYLNDNELTFTNEKAYIIYGYAAVPADKTLTIEAGARIHFHEQSGLIIDKGATLIVDGTSEEKVVFEGDRLENLYSTLPGQWGAIWLRPGSKNNEIKNAVIKNGTIGILVDSITSNSEPTLKLENTEIYNHTAFGVLGRNTYIESHNIVLGNSGQSSFSAIDGGSYNFTHATFANYWNNGIRSTPAVIVSNELSTEDENGNITLETHPLNEANFKNCIIEGNNNIEFILNKTNNNEVFNYNISNCLIRFNDVNNTYSNSDQLNFNNIIHYQNNLLNSFPDFKNTSENDFNIGENSEAINNASTTTFSFDLLRVDRSSSPDIGAYQHIIFEEE